MNAVTGLDSLHSGIRGISEAGDLRQYIPAELATDDLLQTDIPRIARDPGLMSLVDNAVHEIPTEHLLCCDDARNIGNLPVAGVHLVLTSPPYWTLKQYREHDAQLGHISQYEEFLVELDKVWKQVHDVLVPGGRLICVVGDVCVSRRKNGGRHAVMPLHSSIQEHCRQIGFDNLAPIIWHKIANATYEAGGNSTFLGKPYEPNAVIKNDIEYILMQRKPGGYRSPSAAENPQHYFRGEPSQVVPADLDRADGRIHKRASRALPA